DADAKATTRTVGVRTLGAGATDEGQFELTILSRPERLEKAIANSIGMKLVMIPASTFTMGSPEDEPNRLNDEHPHEVTITRPFYLGVHEVTQGEYARVMGTNPSYFSAAGGSADRVAGLDTRPFPVET